MAVVENVGRVKEMAVVETFLLEQLAESIKKKPDKFSSIMSSISTMSSIHKECSELKDVIEKQMLKDGAPVDSKLKEKLYYLNNIMSEWRVLLEKDSLCTPKSLQNQHNVIVARAANALQERLKKIKKDLPDVAKEGSVPRVEEPGSVPHLEVYRWSSRLVDPEKIYGVEDEAKIVERMLVKEGFKAIGFVGMTGVGKTAFCQKAFSNKQVKKHFHPRIWVCSSMQPNIDDYKQELVKRMLTCLGFEKKIIEKVGEGDDGLKRLVLALQRQLKRQRYLIVLDDVRNIKEDFDDFCSCLAQDDRKDDRLAYGLPKGHEGAVIVTSRSPIIMENVVGEKNFLSLPLADKVSCWKIFVDAANKDGVALTEDIKLKNAIVKECAGLPLIAKMLGKIEHNAQKMSHQIEAQKETHQQEA